MTTNYSTQRVTAPTAFVTKGRQRVKQYDNTIYLKNGDEFELELFNPTTNKVLARISLNGKSLGSGIILRPGERVFLERYFDEAKKFLFETYEIDRNDYDAVQATKMNGIVEVEFYDEHKPSVWIANPSPLIWYAGTYTYYPPQPQPYYYSNAGGIGTGYSSQSVTTGYSSQSVTTRSGDNVTYTCSCNNAKAYVDGDLKANALSFAAPVASSPVETGRVEKGSTSNQSFVYFSFAFNSWYSWSVRWTILPESQKPLVKEDLKVFCTTCGAKRKKTSHKFCPNCGEKF